MTTFEKMTFNVPKYNTNVLVSVHGTRAKSLISDAISTDFGLIECSLSLIIRQVFSFE